MREVERSQFMDSTPAELDNSLSPSAVLEAGGTFTVVDSEATDGGQRVTAWKRRGELDRLLETIATSS